MLISAISLLTFACEKNDENIDYKQEMRDFVIGISGYSKSIFPDFIVIPQNGIELITTNGDEAGQFNAGYLSAIDGNGQEDLFFGYDKDDKATPVKENEYLRAFLDISKNSGNIILVTDYCSTHSKMDDSFSKNLQNGIYIFCPQTIGNWITSLPIHWLSILLMISKLQLYPKFKISFILLILKTLQANQISSMRLQPPTTIFSSWICSFATEPNLRAPKSNR